MSRLGTPQGDDHPDAAGKHLQDAKVLLIAGRADGAAYLSGYVVECSLKSLWLFELGEPIGGPQPWRRGSAHDLASLRAQVASLAVSATARIARYLGSTINGATNTILDAWSP